MKIFSSVWCDLNTWKCKHKLATIKMQEQMNRGNSYYWACCSAWCTVFILVWMKFTVFHKKMLAQIITNHPKIRWSGRRKKKATTIAHIRTYQPPLKNLSIKSQIWVLNHKQPTNFSIKPPNQHKPNQIHSNIHPKIQIIKPTKKKKQKTDKPILKT